MDVERNSVVFERIRDLGSDKTLTRLTEAFGRSGSAAGLEHLLAGEVPVRSSHLEFHPASNFWKLEELTSRSDLWVVQQWLFIRDCAFERNQHESFKSLEIVKNILSGWIEAHPDQAENDNEKLAWHDHVVALRALNFLHYLVLVSQSGVDIYHYASFAPEFIKSHIEALSSPEFYTVGTNHGYDQAFALFLLSHLFEPSGPTRGLALERLRNEISTSFAADGGHIENSPSYHPLMMHRLITARAVLTDFGEADAAHEIEDVLDRALLFLAHCLKPDRTLPLLGDSQVQAQGRSFRDVEQLPSYERYLYSVTQGTQGRSPAHVDRIFAKSGYAFLRDRWHKAADFRKGLHLTFKCGFLSSYHRHDDDNSILLFAFGEDWLIDGGMLNYDEESIMRRYLRSSRAHNMISVVDCATTRSLRKGRQPSAFSHWKVGKDATTVTGVTRMFVGAVYERTVIYDRVGAIELVDKVQQADSDVHDVELRFHVPDDKDVQQVDGRTVVVSSRMQPVQLRLVLDIISEKLTMERALQHPEPSGFTSPTLNVVTPAQTIACRYHGAPKLELRTEMRFETEKG